MRQRNLFSFVSACVLLLSVSAGAQQIKDTQVPAAVKASFTKTYPATKAGWEIEGGVYEASFKKDGKSMSVMIDKGGNITETETDIPVSQLPKAVTAYLQQHYKGAKIKEAARIVKADGQINYEGEVNNKDVVFDSNGNFIRETKD
jgi:biopolymer transport protein ExbD